ncbi:glycoside hydrolase [Naematelia encephala]|uniref:Beta-mannosidase B n=1 Tax=Naematelia encephala TaxID=71784 RepID=A0A1Y2AH40_9TREE|nr:glycoside hydrolase [Naematelia encephala]
MSLQVIKPTTWQYAESPVYEPHAVVPDLKGAEWTDCTQFPTEIHLELRAAGRIPDWNKGRAEHDVQWVAEKTWAFRSVISINVAKLNGLDKAELEFESLDTFATVFLVEVPVTSLKASNELLIVFRPPEPIANALGAQHGPFRGGSCNLGNRARMGIRKSQYHFRWDWGPELLCMGPDRPVYLRLYESRIQQVTTRARVDPKLQRSLVVDVELQGQAKKGKVTLTDAGGKVIKQAEIAESVSWDLGEDVELWWPVGHGAQPLYTVKVELFGQDGSVVDTLTRRVGFRRTILVEDPVEGEEGTSFCFEINNKRIFCGGINWIPIDNLLPTGTPERYRKWLELMVRGNQNMVRIWGGGVYEPDVFYDLCDELGLLVWQDFMFACGVYPVFPEFMASVKAEAEYNVARLGHHPSLAIFCGNNEDYQMVLQWDIKQSGDPLPARKIYEHLLPEVVERLTDPQVPYWRGSPYGGKGWDTADPTVGDVHQWEVWGGKEKPYQDYDIMGGRFVSEFGLPSLPSLKTINFWLDGDDTQAHPQSKLMQQHNKAGSHERRLAICMNENFRITADLESYAYLTRLMQSEGVGQAYVDWRRGFKGPGKELCSGALVWQLNDCWPVSSWAIIDYFFRPKAAYYSIKRAMAPVSLGLRRTVTKNRETDRPRSFYEYGAFQSRQVSLDIWAATSIASTTTRVVVSAVDLCSSWTATVYDQQVTLGANRSTELWSGECPAPPLEQAHDKTAPSGTVVVHVVLIDQDGQVIARQSNWPEPYKFLDLPDPALKVQVKGDQVHVSAQRPVKCVWLDVQGDDDADIVWSDNALDVMPGDTQVVKVDGLNGRKVTVAYLGKERASLV